MEQAPKYSKYEHFKSIVTDSDLPLSAKIHFFEADISEAVYKFWCKITGHKFERKKKDRPNCCLLVTKTGFHLISNLLRNILGDKMYVTPRQLEVYQMNCPEKVQYGLGQTAYYYWFQKNLNCRFCGRCYELQEGDKKIVGKF